MAKKSEESKNNSQEPNMVYHKCMKCGERFGYPKWMLALGSPIAGWQWICPKCQKSRF